MRNAERFAAFVPRKVAAKDVDLPAAEERSLPPAPVVPSPLQPVASSDAIELEETPAEAPRPTEATATTDRAGSNSRSCAGAAIEAVTRARAVELAIAATGQALRGAVAMDASAIARFVDDAVAAAGEYPMECCRLNPEDARAVAGGGLRVVADPSIERGGLLLEGSGVRIGASLGERAELLVRREADA